MRRNSILNNSEQPEHQNQDQQSAKTDIHALSPSVLPKKPPARRWRSNRCGSVTVVQPLLGLPVAFLNPKSDVSPLAGNTRGIILPVQKCPLLLDFPPLARN
jgi:hypothetical protein